MVTAPKPILVIGDSYSVFIAYNTKYKRDFTAEASSKFIGGVFYGCSITRFVSGNYNNYIADAIVKWNHSTARFKNAPLDLIMLFGQFDLYLEYFYRYRALGRSDQDFIDEFIANYNKLIEAKLSEFTRGTIYVVAVLPFLADNLAVAEQGLTLSESVDIMRRNMEGKITAVNIAADKRDVL